jgi:hypothetical protein
MVTDVVTANENTQQKPNVRLWMQFVLIHNKAWLSTE